MKIIGVVHREVNITVLRMLFRSEVLLLKQVTVVLLALLCRTFTVQFMVRNVRELTMTANSLRPCLLGLYLLRAMLWHRRSNLMGLIFPDYTMLILWQAGKF